MVAERKAIDIEHVTQVEALTRELDEHREGLVLRRAGRVIATLTSNVNTMGNPGDSLVVAADEMPLASRPISDERLQRILAIVESMRGIDTDAMHRLVDESRQHSIEMQHQAIEPLSTPTR